MRSISRFAALALPGIFLASPLIAFGQGVSFNTQWLSYYYALIVSTINGVLVPVLMAVAFIVFLWGVFRYFVWGAHDEAERTVGRKFVLWGVIGFVVITSVWGLVNVVKMTLIPSGANITHPPAYPTL